MKAFCLFLLFAITILIAGCIPPNIQLPVTALPVTTHKIVRFCYVGDKNLPIARITELRPSNEGYLVQENVVCLHIMDEESYTLLDTSQFFEKFPALMGKDPKEYEWIGILQCGSRGATAAPQSATMPITNGLASNVLPTEDKEKAQAGCAGPLQSGIPNLGMGNRGNSGPSSSAVKCSQNNWNPLAEDGGATSKAPPTKSEITFSFLKDWASMTSTAYGGTKGISTVTTAPISLIGLVVTLETVGEKAAQRVGDLMERTYLGTAIKAGEVAVEAAKWAEESSTQAAASAASCGCQASAQKAQEALAHEMEAKRLAAEAVAAAQQAGEAKTRKELAEAYQKAVDAANRAKEEAKKAAQAASDAEEEAKKAGGGVVPEEAQQPVGPDSTSECEKIRQEIEDCESVGWATSPCQILLNKLKGCDVTIMYTVDGTVSCGGVEIDPGELLNAAIEKCREITDPEPGEDPCAPMKITELGGVNPFITPAGECDPTIAYEEGGCVAMPAVTVKTTTFCLPAPPYAPKPPCIKTGGENPKPGPLPDPSVFDSGGWFITEINGAELDGATMIHEVNSWGYGSSISYGFVGQIGVPPGSFGFLDLPNP